MSAAASSAVARSTGARVGQLDPGGDDLRDEVLDERAAAPGRPAPAAARSVPGDLRAGLLEQRREPLGEVAPASAGVVTSSTRSSSSAPRDQPRADRLRERVGGAELRRAARRRRPRARASRR